LRNSSRLFSGAGGTSAAGASPTLVPKN
jgi:hypothetical protein